MQSGKRRCSCCFDDDWARVVGGKGSKTPSMSRKMTESWFLSSDDIELERYVTITIPYGTYPYLLALR